MIHFSIITIVEGIMTDNDRSEQEKKNIFTTVQSSFLLCLDLGGFIL